MFVGEVQYSLESSVHQRLKSSGEQLIRGPDEPDHAVRYCERPVPFGAIRFPPLRRRRRRPRPRRVAIRSYGAVDRIGRYH